MQVKLKVLDGASAGRELPVPGPEFVIGRSEECHLRPKSDMVSRRHCSLVIKEGQVILRDFGSKNGTYINEQRVEGEKVLDPNDVLRIGPLKFGVLFDKGTSKLAKPAAAAAAPAKEPARAAAAPTATGGKTATADVEDDDISSWLSDIDAAEREQRKFQPETRQFKLTDKDRDDLEKAAGDTAAAKTDDTKVPKEKEKKEPGKLPVRPDSRGKSSQEAAANMLKKFFKST
jgi:pSer/pThr/pTyr-binding forkhead associated (FHA) protein